jgi:hypothetical protein
LEYLPALEIDEELARIVQSLEMDHVHPQGVRAIRRLLDNDISIRIVP